MQKQIASFNTFVSHQTLPISSCDGLCTDQNDTAASVHLRDDIAVVCSKLSQTSQYQTTNAKQLVLSNAMERSDMSITTAQRTPVRSYNSTQIDAKHLAILSYDLTVVQ
jgi:vacuolar-type H+-ATPase subunit B/Vma2